VSPAELRAFDRAVRIARAEERSTALRLAKSLPARALNERWRADFRLRLERARARRLGMDIERYRSTIVVAIRIWCARWPMRWLPHALAVRLFARFGARLVAVTLQSVVTEAPDGA
jgi:hypothetical protein